MYFETYISVVFAVQLEQFHKVVRSTHYKSKNMKNIPIWPPSSHTRPSKCVKISQIIDFYSPHTYFTSLIIGYHFVSSDLQWVLSKMFFHGTWNFLLFFMHLRSQVNTAIHHSHCLSDERKIYSLLSSSF